MDEIDHKNTNLINLNSARSVKEFVLTANERIQGLEQALYNILDCSRIDVAHEIAADVLNEDLEEYYANDDLERAELDFENEDDLPWEEITQTRWENE